MPVGPGQGSDPGKMDDRPLRLGGAAMAASKKSINEGQDRPAPRMHPLGLCRREPPARARSHNAIIIAEDLRMPATTRGSPRRPIPNVADDFAGGFQDNGRLPSQLRNSPRPPWRSRRPQASVRCGGRATARLACREQVWRRRMLGWRPLALGMASSLFFVAAAEAQQATGQACRHHRAPAGDGAGRSTRAATARSDRHCTSTETFGAGESAR